MNQLESPDPDIPAVKGSAKPPSIELTPTKEVEVRPKAKASSEHQLNNGPGPPEVGGDTTDNKPGQTPVLDPDTVVPGSDTAPVQTVVEVELEPTSGKETNQTPGLDNNGASKTDDDDIKPGVSLGTYISNDTQETSVGKNSGKRPAIKDRHPELERANREETKLEGRISTPLTEVTPTKGLSPSPTSTVTLTNTSDGRASELTITDELVVPQDEFEETGEGKGSKLDRPEEAELVVEDLDDEETATPVTVRTVSPPFEARSDSELSPTKSVEDPALLGGPASPDKKVESGMIPQKFNTAPLALKESSVLSDNTSSVSITDSSPLTTATTPSTMISSAEFVVSNQSPFPVVKSTKIAKSDPELADYFVVSTHDPNQVVTKEGPLREEAKADKKEVRDRGRSPPTTIQGPPSSPYCKCCGACSCDCSHPLSDAEEEDDCIPLFRDCLSFLPFVGARNRYNSETVTTDSTAQHQEDEKVKPEDQITEVSLVLRTRAKKPSEDLNATSSSTQPVKLKVQVIVDQTEGEIINVTAKDVFSVGQEPETEGEPSEEKMKQEPESEPSEDQEVGQEPESEPFVEKVKSPDQNSLQLQPLYGSPVQEERETFSFKGILNKLAFYRQLVVTAVVDDKPGSVTPTENVAVDLTPNPTVLRPHAPIPAISFEELIVTSPVTDPDVFERPDDVFSTTTTSTNKSKKKGLRYRIKRMFHFNFKKSTRKLRQRVRSKSSVTS